MRWVFIFDLKDWREWKRMPDRERNQRVPDRRSHILKWSLPQGPSAHPRNTEDASSRGWAKRARRRVETMTEAMSIQRHYTTLGHYLMKYRWQCPPRDTTRHWYSTCWSNIFGHVHPETLHSSLPHSTLLAAASLAVIRKVVKPVAASRLKAGITWRVHRSDWVAAETTSECVKPIELGLCQLAVL